MLNGQRKQLHWSLPTMLFAALSFLFCLPLLQNLYSSSSGDWDYFMSLYEVPSISLFEYGQFPLWNPYCGGGISLIGNPQAGYLSPIFLLTALFGVAAGLKLAVWLHTFLGLWGMWLLSGYLGITGPARLAPPFIFIFSGAWALHLAAGHIVWLPAALLPFFFLALLKGRDNRYWLLAAAVLESLMFYEGGTYVLAFSLLLVFAYLAVDSLVERSLRPLLAFLMVNIVAAALSAPKLLPVLELLQSHPRPTGAGGSLPLDIFFSLFIDRFKGLEKRLYNTGWWEFGSYLGIVVIVLYLFSFTKFRENKALLISSLFMLFLALGNFGTLSPWNILHELPLFSGLQVPTRSLIVFCFSVALLAGRSLAYLAQGNHKWSQLLVTAVVLLILCDLASVSFPSMLDAQRPITTSYWEGLRKEQALAAPKLYQIPPGSSADIWHSVSSFHQPFRQISIPFSERNAHGAWSDQYLPLLQNIGVVDAYETIPFTRYTLALAGKNYKEEYHLTRPGTVSLAQWRPNRFVFQVDTTDGNRLVINQNFARGWQSSQGIINSHNGLLAIDLPEGNYQFEVYYLPRSLIVGAFLYFTTSGIILIVMALKFFKKKHF